MADRTSPSPASSSPALPWRPGWDALLLAVLLVARLRLNFFAENTLFEHFKNVTTHSLLGRLLSDQAEAAFGPWLGDPIALLLAALSLAALIIYLIVDVVDREKAVGGQGQGAGSREEEFSTAPTSDDSDMPPATRDSPLAIRPTPPAARHPQLAPRLKRLLVWLIIALTVLLPSVELALLRHENLPQSYSHDGGVLQTEAAIDFFLSGRNPYVEDYRNTPMAEWGLPEFRTALDHYPYLPWTFAFSAPFKLLSDALLGWYDQRFVYLLVFVVGLILAARLAPEARPRWRLGLLMLLGLNPIMGQDLIFGQNDLFVWAWIVLALFLLRPRANSSPAPNSSLIIHHSSFLLPPSSFLLPPSSFLLSSFAFGLACASKPTAWFMAPFFALLLVRDQVQSWRDIPRALPALLKRGWPALAAFLVIVGPYLIWNPNALVDDVWRWAAGTSETHYQIWGWGASNFVLAFGRLSSRLDYWPFWVPELIVAVPLLLWFGWRQIRYNGLGPASWHYALFLLAFFYVSRFLNENYLGFILAFLAIGYFATDPGKEEGGRRKEEG